MREMHYYRVIDIRIVLMEGIRAIEPHLIESVERRESLENAITSIETGWEYTREHLDKWRKRLDTLYRSMFAVMNEYEVVEKVMEDMTAYVKCYVREPNNLVRILEECRTDLRNQVEIL